MNKISTTQKTATIATVAIFILVSTIELLMSAIPAFAGLDSLTNSSGWTQSLLVPGNYTSVAVNTYKVNGPCYVALPTGGIDFLSKDTSTGAFVTYHLITGTTYISITRDSNNSGALYGVRSDGGVDSISWNGSWVAMPLLNGNYVAVCPNTDTSVGGCYCARSDNGIDYIHYSSGWRADSLIRGTTYKDIAEDAVHPGLLFGVRSNGGIDWISNTGSWTAKSLVNGNYVSVANSSSTSITSCYAARADGGVDWIHYSSGWVATSLGVGGKYLDIAADIGDNGSIYGACIHESVSIAVAKTRTVGSHVQCSGTVSGVMNGQFQIQDADGSAGVRVIPDAGINAAQYGYSVTISGVVRSMPTGEKYIQISQNAGFSQIISSFLAPVIVPNNLVVSKAGLLVTTTGTIIEKTGRDTITLTDSTVTSLKAVDPWQFAGYKLFAGKSVTITGIASYEMVGGNPSPMIILTGWKVN